MVSQIGHLHLDPDTSLNRTLLHTLSLQNDNSPFSRVSGAFIFVLNLIYIMILVSCRSVK